jgi:hypothetical protein
VCVCVCVCVYVSKRVCIQPHAANSLSIKTVEMIKIFSRHLRNVKYSTIFYYILTRRVQRTSSDPNSSDAP